MKLKICNILLLIFLLTLTIKAQTLAVTPVATYEAASAPAPQYDYPSVTILDPTATLNTTVNNILLQPRKSGSKSTPNSLMQSGTTYSASALHTSRTKGVSAQGGIGGSSMTGSAILRQASTGYTMGESIGTLNNKSVVANGFGPPPPGGGNTDENPSDDNRLPLGDIPVFFFLLLSVGFGRKKLKMS